jgi:hypothetical protein
MYTVYVEQGMNLVAAIKPPIKPSKGRNNACFSFLDASYPQR